MFDHSKLVGLSNREKVLLLRGDGYAFKKIAKVLAVPYPLVEYWSRGGTLSKHEFFERERSAGRYTRR